jgi:hypothetical protein
MNSSKRDQARYSNPEANQPARNARLGMNYASPAAFPVKTLFFQPTPHFSQQSNSNQFKPNQTFDFFFRSKL